MTDPKWMRPGLPFATGKLNEEAGEVMACLGLLVFHIGKTMRFGFLSYNPDTKISNEEAILNTLDELQVELEDLKHASAHFRQEFLKTLAYERERMFEHKDC